MSEAQFDEMGPIDYVVLEWPGDTPVTGEVMALLLDLVDRGTIRILDLAFVAKGEDGVGGGDGPWRARGGWQRPCRVPGRVVGPARPGRPRRGRRGDGARHRRRRARLGEPLGGPVAIALRRSGGQLVASGRIPVQAILAALDASRATPN